MGGGGSPQNKGEGVGLSPFCASAAHTAGCLASHGVGRLRVLWDPRGAIRCCVIVGRGLRGPMVALEEAWGIAGACG